MLGALDALSHLIFMITLEWIILPNLKMRKIRPTRVLCLTQVLRASEKLIWPPSPAFFLSSKSAFPNGELNLLAPKFAGYFLENWVVRNKQPILNKATNWIANVPLLYINRWFLAKIDFKVISVKQILLVYHCGTQDAFPRKEFPSLLHYKYLVNGNDEQPLADTGHGSKSSAVGPCWLRYSRKPLSPAMWSSLLSETPWAGLWHHPGSS